MRNLRTFFLVLMAVFSVTAFAESKIAVVDIGAAIFNTEVAKARQKELQAKSDYAALQAKYDSTTADIKTLQKEAETNRMTWSQEQVADFQKKMEYYRADLELTARKLQSEIKDLQNSILKELQPKAIEALEELVKEDGVTLLFRAEAVLLAGPELNLTQKLTDRLNKKTQ